MIYSCCKQIVGPSRTPTSMQRLTPGSVICFGSTIDHAFCLDTVFVVGSSQPWTAGATADLEANEAFIACTAEPIALSPDANVELTLYRSATYTSPVGGTFSFVPARCADQPDPRFARPAIELEGLIKASNRQSTWGSKRPLTADEVREAWLSVRQQVIAAGLSPAVALDIPLRHGETAPAVASERVRC